MGAHMTPEDHDKTWDLVEASESYTAIGKVIGRRLTTNGSAVTPSSCRCRGCGQWRHSTKR